MISAKCLLLPAARCVSVTDPAAPRFHPCGAGGTEGPRGAVRVRVTFVTPKGAAAAAVLPREDEAARPGSLFRQLITDDEDTAAPSLFKLGWLSGMTK